MLMMDTREAKKESIRLLEELPGSWFLDSESLKNKSYSVVWLSSADAGNGRVENKSDRGTYLKL